MSYNLKEAYDVETEYSAFFTGGQVEWTADGTQMLCQCNDTIKIVDLGSGLIKSCLGDTKEDLDEDTIYCFALSHDSRYVVSAHKSGLIKLWSFNDGKVEKMWRSVHKGPIAVLTFNTSGNIIATGGSDGTARLWNISNQTCQHSLKGAQGVFSVLKFHPDKTKNIIFGSADDTKIICWDAATGKIKHTYVGHFSKVTSLNFTIDGEHMVTSGRDRVLILWSIAEEKAIRTLPVFESLEGSVVLPIKFQLPNRKIKKSDGGVYVACAGEKGVIKVWDLSSSTLIYTQTNSVISPASDDGSLAITQLLLNEVRGCLSVVSADHNIFIYDLSTFHCSKLMVGFSDEILDVCFLCKNDTHIALATNSIDIKVYELVTMNCQLVKGHTDLVLSLSKSPKDPNLFLSSSKDNTIRLWLLNSEKEIVCLAVGNRHTSSVGSVCLPLLDVSFCFSVSKDTCVKRWNIPDFTNQQNMATMLCTHTEIAHTKDINHITISPNDKIIATGSQDKTIKLWSSEDLSNLGTLRGHKRGVWCVKFSPTDQVLLSTSADCTMKLWSLNELNCLKTIEGHASSVLNAEFLSKGLQIITSGADGLLKIWSIKSSECVTTLDKHHGRVWAMAISESEDCIVTGGADSLLIRWKDITIQKREKEAKAKEELALQEQELSNLLHERKLAKALKLSLRLEKPYQTLKIINEILKDDDEKLLSSTICQLNANYLQSLLKCCVEWNTNTRNCQVAQTVLHIMLSNDNLDKNSVTAIRELIPYTQRHMQRITSMLQDLQFLNFTLNCMQPHGTSMS